uniref:Uncharacterized protein n=1 Tax=Romanomermis culicivorax TaxID=13658 RepID=A0A915HNF1_ROMCU
MSETTLVPGSNAARKAFDVSGIRVVRGSQKYGNSIVQSVIGAYTNVTYHYSALVCMVVGAFELLARSFNAPGPFQILNKKCADIFADPKTIPFIRSIFSVLLVVMSWVRLCSFDRRLSSHLGPLHGSPLAKTIILSVFLALFAFDLLNVNEVAKALKAGTNVPPAAHSDAAPSRLGYLASGFMIKAVMYGVEAGTNGKNEAKALLTHGLIVEKYCTNFIAPFGV